MKNCKLYELFRTDYAIRKANYAIINVTWTVFFLSNFKSVLCGFVIRKTLFCCPKDILNRKEYIHRYLTHLSLSPLYIINYENFKYMIPTDAPSTLYMKPNLAATRSRKN